MKTLHIIPIVLFLLCTISIQAQTPCEIDTSYSIAGGDFEEMDSSYLTPVDTFYTPDTFPTDPPSPPPPPLADSTRYVVWLHGLGGDQTAWSKMASPFSNANLNFPHLSRKILSHKTSYGIQEDAGDTYSIAKDIFEDESHLPRSHTAYPDLMPERTILIGHSQGGIIIRQMDRHQSQAGLPTGFGGYATFCTANQGAEIINNQTMVQGFLFDMGNALHVGPLSEFTKNGNWLVRVAARSIKVDNIASFMVNFFARDIGQYLINTSLPNVTDDYKVGSEVINVLNSYTPTTEERVAFYSRSKLVDYTPYEDTIVRYFVNASWNGPFEITEFEEHHSIDLPVPISLRTLQYFINPPQNYDYFTAEDHWYELAVKFHKMQLDYQAKSDKSQAIVDFCDGIRIGIPAPPGAVACAFGRNAAKERADAWQEGVDFLNDFDRRYRAFVGILELEKRTENRKYCICQERGVPEPIETGPYPLDFDCDLIADPDSDCRAEIRPTEVKKWVNHRSDGVVLEESQKNIPQATRPPVRLPDGATHMEVRNTEMTKKRLEEFFDGKKGRFFKTPKFY